MVLVRPALRFRHDAVDKAQFFEMSRSELQRFGRLRGMAAVFPEDGGTSFRADDRVIRVFHNEDAIGNANAERPAGPAFADDYGDNRCLEQHHFAQVDRNGFGDVALFRADAGEGARGIDQGNDG